MPFPQPSVPLTDVCSAVYQNTLYTYSSGAFQSLSLTPGAQWKQLPSGESVTGAVCVGSTPKDASQAGFFVVGGKGPTGYKGLQKFTYSTGKWESVTPMPLVTQDRLWHNAVYLNASDMIMMYAGNQDGTQHPSSQTFTIMTSPPYQAIAWQSIAPPTINPILLPWSDSQAVLLGGSSWNDQVMLFDAKNGWADSKATLATPLPKNSSEVKAAIVTGDDGCKNLYTFDMTVSPNQVNRTVLLDGKGVPVQKSAAITGPSRRTRRQTTKELTLDDWPKYNATLAPKATRTTYSVAQDPNGMIVLAGGNDKDILCMFDGRGNGWINATQRLTDQSVSVSGATPSGGAASPSGTSGASGNSTAPAVAGEQSSPMSANTILGIVLGSMAGFAVFLVLVYALIRCRRRKQDFADAGHNRRSSGVASPEKGGYGFASDSLPQGPAKGTFRGHQPQDSHNSFSSMTILMGRVNQPKQGGIQRNNSKDTKRSSTDSVFKAFKSTISKPIPQGQDQGAGRAPSPMQARDERGVSFGPNVAEPRPRAAKVDRQGSLRRSSGWNRYWSGGSALNILGFGNGRRDSRRMTAESDQSSQYSADQHRITQDSATVPPLHVAPMVPDPKPKFQRVNSGSPTMANYDNRIRDEMRAQIERSHSRTSSISGYSSGIPASVHDTWDPTAASSKPWGSNRAPGNAYGQKFTTTLTPAAAQGRQIPSGVSKQPQLSHTATSSDMSWLNLGEFPRGV